MFLRLFFSMCFVDNIAMVGMHPQFVRNIWHKFLASLGLSREETVAMIIVDLAMIVDLCKYCLNKRGIKAPESSLHDIKVCRNATNKCTSIGARVKMVNHKWVLVDSEQSPKWTRLTLKRISLDRPLSRSSYFYIINTALTSGIYYVLNYSDPRFKNEITW